MLEFIQLAVAYYEERKGLNGAAVGGLLSIKIGALGVPNGLTRLSWWPRDDLRKTDSRSRPGQPFYINHVSMRDSVLWCVLSKFQCDQEHVLICDNSVVAL